MNRIIFVVAMVLVVRLSAMNPQSFLDLTPKKNNQPTMSLQAKPKGILSAIDIEGDYFDNPAEHQPAKLQQVVPVPVLAVVITPPVEPVALKIDEQVVEKPVHCHHEQHAVLPLAISIQTPTTLPNVVKRKKIQEQPRQPVATAEKMLSPVQESQWQSDCCELGRAITEWWHDDVCGTCAKIYSLFLQEEAQHDEESENPITRYTSIQQNE